MSLPDRPDCYRFVVGLRAVRWFESTPIAAEDRDAILEAGRWTGSARNRQAWAFVVASEPEDIARFALAGRPDGPLSRAALAVALVRLPDGIDFDMGRAAQNMMLAAAARGIASCPVTLHNQDAVPQVLGLPDDEHEALRAIAFGYPAVEAEAASRKERRQRGAAGRKPLDELVHEGRFRT
jgi:nitroreductase